MATIFLPNAAPFLPSTSASSHIPRKQPTAACKAAESPSPISRRSIAAATTLLLFTTFKPRFDANAAILEADDDEELLEKVKKDRKRRLEKQGVIKSSALETAYLQDLVYKLSKVGQAIEKDDISTASLALGPSNDPEWIKNVNSAFDKLSSSSEEKKEVVTFNTSLTSLISSVSKGDIQSSKVAFVALASAFEKWTTLSGLVEQLKGL